MYRSTAAAFVLFTMTGAAQAQLFSPITSVTHSPITRETASPFPGQRNADGDTFEAAVLIGGSPGLFYLDDFPDDFIYDPSMNPQDNGDHLGTGVPTILEIFETSLGTDMDGNFLFQICVIASTADGSPWIGGLYGSGFNELYFDLGTGTSTAANGIDFSKPGFMVLDAIGVLLADGEVVGTVPTLIGTPMGGPLADITGFVLSETGAGLVDGIGICWTIKYIPTPGALALFGLTGFVASRRRRA